MLTKEEIKHLITRLERAVDLIDQKNPHMAVAALLADISVLRTVLIEGA